MGKESDSASIFDTQLLLDGACLEDTTRLVDLNLGTNAQLQVIRSRKSAREILFEGQEVAFALADHYDALQDECAEHIGSLFLDEDGNDRSCRAKMEVLIALHAKLSKSEGKSGLAGLKAALTEVALEILRGDYATDGEIVQPGVRHSETLVRCFPWFGLEAVQTLLGSSAILLMSLEKLKSTLVSEYAKHPVRTLRELLTQVPAHREYTGKYDTCSPQHKLRTILEEAIQAIKDREIKLKAQKMAKRQMTKSYATARATPIAWPTKQLLVTPDEVLAVAKTGDYFLNLVSDSVVELKCADSTRRATLSAVLAAMQQEPESLLLRVGLSLALAAVEECWGIYNYLPEDLKGDRDILYMALAQDSALRSEFMSTASKSEVQQFQWHMDRQQRKKKKKSLAQVA